MNVMQVKVEVQAFLTMPDLAAMQTEQIDHCQVINPFSIETAVDHCVEPTLTGPYRFARLLDKYCPVWQRVTLPECTLVQFATCQPRPQSCQCDTLDRASYMVPQTTGLMLAGQCCIAGLLLAGECCIAHNLCFIISLTKSELSNGI